MPVFTDQLNRTVFLPDIPQRIVSTVPSQTELLFDLGLGNHIAGITNFCIHPANKTKTTTKIGGTKKLNIELIKKLGPDLIIANKEENERSQIEELKNYFPVWISDIYDLQDAISMIQSVGAMLGQPIEARSIATEIVNRFKLLQAINLKPRVAYLIWRKPYMAAGKNTFINAMLQQCGFINAFEVERYPVIDNETWRKTNPDIVFLSSEPYPFKDKHIAELKTLLPQAKVVLVDGEMFSWYGSRLLQAPGYFAELISILER